MAVPTSQPAHSFRKTFIISAGHEQHPHYAHFTATLAIGLVSKGLNN